MAALVGCSLSVGLTGCGGAHPSDAAFRSRVTRICLEANRTLTGSPRTKQAFATRQRLAYSYLDRLSGLHPATVSEERTYRDLVLHMRHIAAFLRANESQLIRLNRETAHPRHPRAALKRVQRVLRPIASDETAVFHDLSVLGLTQCPALVGL